MKTSAPVSITPRWRVSETKSSRRQGSGSFSQRCWPTDCTAITGQSRRISWAMAWRIRHSRRWASAKRSALPSSIQRLANSLISGGTA
jgi:hypothetical protein